VIYFTGYISSATGFIHDFTINCVKFD